MKKNLAHVLISNVICLIINLLINILLPKYVSIDTYTLIKTYALYVSYAGFFHFGYNDGMYLKYGGKDIKNINHKDLGCNFFNYLFLIILMFGFVLCIAFALNDYIVFAFAFGMVSYNLLGYLKYLYQATGSFKLYGLSLNAEKILIFIFTIVSIFILHSDNYLLYIGIQALVGLVIAIVLIINLNQRLHFLKYGKLDIKEIITNIKSGFILMIGNFSNSIFTGLDRWFVKYLLTSFDFAMYSFAASLEAIVNVFISPITIIMYNYFCNEHNTKEINRIKKLTLVYSFFVIIIAYPAKFLLETFLPKYISASNIIFYLFGAQLFYVIVKGIYINLYKAQQKQIVYLKQMIIMITIGFITNIIAYVLFKNADAIALATFVTSIIWLILCEIKSKEYRYSLKEIFAIIIICCTYLLTGQLLNSVLGCIIYTITMIAVIYILMNESFIYGIDVIKKLIAGFKNKGDFKNLFYITK